MLTILSGRVLGTLQSTMHMGTRLEVGSWNTLAFQQGLPHLRLCLMGQRWAMTPSEQTSARHKGCSGDKIVLTLLKLISRGKMDIEQAI